MYHFTMEIIAIVGALFACFEIFNNYSNIIYDFIFGKQDEN